MDVYEKYRLAGKIAGDALKKGIKNIKEGTRYRDVAENIEKYIRERAGLSFPVNISVNSIAAHFTPSLRDETVFKRGDVIKLDIGSHIDGYIGDTAKTVEIGTNEYGKLIESAETALEEAIKVVHAGIKIEEISRTIETKINEYGFSPIKNLQGHSLEQYKLHAGISIPNFYVKNDRRLKEGQIIAVEPFSTDGKGIVKDKGLGGIYRLTKKSSLTMQIKNRFNEFPFTDRWLYQIYGEKTPFKLSFFMKRKLIAPYFILAEVKKGIVAQAEHTLLITKDGCEVLTAV